ncbi:hypothetical protein N2152v2_002878 [Parachlorella kessleri]
MATKPVLRISIYSDLACPWCYVGKRRLDQALAKVQGKVDAEVEWRAFLLDPNFAPTGEEIEAYARRRFGSNFATIKQRLVDNGKPDGAAFANWRWRANTVKGHMLVALARKHGKSHEANELLFKASYEEGKNISDTPVLLDIASKLGLRDEAARALGSGSSHAAGPAEGSGQLHNAVAEQSAGVGNSCTPDGVCGPSTPASSGELLEEEDDDEGLDGELLREVEADDATAKQRLRVSGVPFFLISAEREPGAGTGPRFALSGAQPAEAFVEAFEEALAHAGK